MIDRELSNLIIIYLISSFLVLLTLIYRILKKKNTIFLDREYINGCDNWCITHIILYIFLGYYASSYWYLLILIGFIFEHIEKQLNKITVHVKGKIVKDTLTNTAGILIGLILFNLFPNKTDLYKIFKSKF